MCELKTRYMYGKPNGAKFKKQNCLHIQQISYQGQERFTYIRTYFISIPQGAFQQRLNSKEHYNKKMNKIIISSH